MKSFEWILLGAVLILTSEQLLVQAHPARRHTETQSDGLDRLEPARQRPPKDKQVEIKIEGQERVIQSNGIPAHQIGRFPNRGNPHQVEEQEYVYRVPATPQPAEEITPLERMSFGVALNGVPYDPAAAEWYLGERESKWQYEAVSGAQEKEGDLLGVASLERILVGKGGCCISKMP